MTFKDVFVEFSRDEWALLDDEQKELHRSVMQSNCEMLLSLCRHLRWFGVCHCRLGCSLWVAFLYPSLGSPAPNSQLQFLSPLGASGGWEAQEGVESAQSLLLVESWGAVFSELPYRFALPRSLSGFLLVFHGVVWYGISLSGHFRFFPLPAPRAASPFAGRTV